MGIFKIDTIGIKTSIFTLLVSVFALFYFMMSTICIYECKKLGIGGSANTLKYSLYVNMIATIISGLIFLYSFVYTYFYNKLLSPNTYTSSMYKILGVFIFSLYMAITIFINVGIFNEAYKHSSKATDSFFINVLKTVFYYSIFAGVFVIIYMIYYIYNNILRTNTHFNNIMLRTKGIEESPVSDDEILTANKIFKGKKGLGLGLKKYKSGNNQELRPFEDDEEIITF